MEAYHTFLHEQKMLENKQEFRHKNKLISIKKSAQKEEKSDMVKKFKAAVTTYKWKVECPSCGKWSLLERFKEKNKVYYCPQKHCFYEITEDRIWNFGNDKQ